MKRTKGEYGGFLPLEIPEQKGHLYSKYRNILSFNTIKAAIPILRRYLNIDTVHVPYYLCPNVIKELKSTFPNVVFFNIDENLLPILDDADNKLIYLVNYFGVMDKKIKKYIKNNPKSVFILDNAHSFYCKPILADNDFNLYSCKKFFGVPDGGFLITKDFIEKEWPATYSDEYSHYLVKSLEQGTNSVYLEKKEVDDRINRNYTGISVFSKKLLCGIDYDWIKNRRLTNFKVLDEAFSGINKIKCEKTSIPYLYPLNFGVNIKKELVSNKIYVPTLWAQCLVDDKNPFEKYLAENTILLPLDQRYDVNDMFYIVQVIKETVDYE